MKLKYISIIAIIVALATGYYMATNQKASHPTNNIEKNLAEMQSVTIGYSRLRISLPVFVAKELGIFKAHGLNVQLKMYETAQPLMQALVGGNIDVGGYTALPITYNAMLRSNKPLYFVSVMQEDQKHRISYLLKAKNSSIISSITDLKGKKIGILPTIAYKAWLEVILKENNLIPGKDVFIQQIAPSLQAQALKSGGVDALFTNDPVATSAIEANVAELISNKVELPDYIQNPFPFGSFNISKKWADNHPDLVSKITSSLDQSIDFINKNPAKAKELMKSYLPVPFQEHVSKYPDALYLTTSQTDTKVFEDIAQKYLKMGIIKKPIKLNGLVLTEAK